MNDLLALVVRLAGENEFASVLDDHLIGNRAFLLALAGAAQKAGRNDDALALVGHVLAAEPEHIEAVLLSVKILCAQGAVDEALRRMVRLRDAGHGARLAVDFRDVLITASAAVNAQVAAGQLKEALRSLDLFILLCPSYPLFVEHALKVATALGDAETIRKYRLELVRQGAPTAPMLMEMADEAFSRRDFDLEFRARQAAFRHPAAAETGSVWRLQNINHLLSRIFIAPPDPVRLNFARELLAAMPSIPPLPPPVSPEDRPALFDRFWRLSMGALDLDATFGPPPAPIAWPKISYARPDGKPLSLDQLAALAKKNGTEVVFLSAASVVYFRRYAKSFVTSMLAASDCECLVIVCISGGKGQLGQLGAELGIDDRRLILAADEMDQDPHGYRIITPSNVDPIPLPLVYYASIGLLCLHELLPALSVPIFNSGIDTVLQRGVRDLIEGRRGADLLLNLNSSTFSMESRITNSLTLTYPTPAGQLFANFMSSYLGGILQKADEPAFFDQMALLMATHHLMANEPSARVEYFGELDTNNLMFRQEHAASHKDFIKKFRFVNIFAGGELSDIAVRPEDITEPATPG